MCNKQTQNDCRGQQNGLGSIETTDCFIHSYGGEETTKNPLGDTQPMDNAALSGSRYINMLYTGKLIWV